MNLKRLGFSSLAFLVPLLGSGQISSAVLPQAGNFMPVLFSTPVSMRQNYSFSLTYVSTALSKNTNFNVIASSLQKDSRGVPFTKTKILYSNSFPSLTSGDSVTILCNIKPEDKMLIDEPNANGLFIQAVPDATFSEISANLKINFFRSVAWKLQGPRLWSVPMQRSGMKNSMGCPETFLLLSFMKAFQIFSKIQPVASFP